MLETILLRILFGGMFVSAFAILSDVLKPKRFAGLFGAAPSVALATLALTVKTQGKLYAAVETRSMVAGSVAFLLYATCVYILILRSNISVLKVTLLLIPLWLAAAFSIWFAWLR
jgi:hypothetical protein